MTNAFKGEDLNNYVPLFKKYAIPVLYNFKESDMKWVEYRPKARMHVLHKIFPEGIQIPDYFFGKNIVHLPTVKCHIYTTTTGAMKNAFGGLLATKRHYTHSWIHRTLVDLLAIQKEIHTGIFAIMDGTTAGNGPGPRTMFPVVKDYMLASDDQVAIDAVAAKMMGFDPMGLEFLKVAHDDKLGVGDPRDIEIVGDDPDAVRRESWGFEVGDNGASVIGDLMWFGPMKKFQKLFFHTPLVNMFIAGSEAYHDYYRWPLKDKRTFENWKRETGWGRLFAAYERGEADRVTKRAQTNGAQAHARRGEALEATRTLLRRRGLLLPRPINQVRACPDTGRLLARAEGARGESAGARLVYPRKLSENDRGDAPRARADGGHRVRRRQ